MLNELKKKAIKSIEMDHTAVLSTYGPSGVQAARYPCQFYSDKLYFLIPTTVDLLDNLPRCADVLVNGSDWQLIGSVRVFEERGQFPEIALVRRSDAVWSKLIEIRPKTVHLNAREGWGFAETIDFD